MSGSVAAARSLLSANLRGISRPTIRSFATTSLRSASKPAPDTNETYYGTNDTSNRDAVPNVSKTNEMAVDNMGVGDNPLIEKATDAEKMRVMQAPNRSTVWSKSQMPRELAMQGPRFEQTIIEVQVRAFQQGKLDSKLIYA